MNPSKQFDVVVAGLAVADIIGRPVEFNKPVGYFGLFTLQDYLEKLLNSPVDLGTPESLKPRLRERIMEEAVRVA